MAQGLQRIIKQVKSQLTWKIEETAAPPPVFTIYSDDRTKTHTIGIPFTARTRYGIEFLHELAHATHAEADYMLGTAPFWYKKKKELNGVILPMQVAHDWFANLLLMEWCPSETKKAIRKLVLALRIREPLFYTYRGLQRRTKICYGGLTFAQAVHYMGHKIENVPYRYRSVVDLLLEVDPSKPDVASIKKLVNQLAGLTCPYRVYVKKKNGMPAGWGIRKLA